MFGRERRTLRFALPAAALALAGGCGPAPDPERGNRSVAASATPEPNGVEAESRDSREAAQPNGLRGYPAPAGEGPAGGGARAAAEVVRSYFELIQARRYEEALRLLDEGGRPGGASDADFAAAFDRYAEYHAEVGTPGRIEGAAGSLRVEVPVRVHGRMKDGGRFAGRGVVVLRRCNDIPGCTEEQNRWRIGAGNIALE